MPPRERKRKSGESTTSDCNTAANASIQMMPTKSAEDDVRESPRKRRKVGISLAQKQALIDNLQLEITERARKLRAHYNIHAQSLRTRIEIRVNRVPASLRKVKMGDLLAKYSGPVGQHLPQGIKNLPMSRLAPVPERAGNSNFPGFHGGLLFSNGLASPIRPPINHFSEDLSGVDKENASESNDATKKPPSRVGTALKGGNPTQVLSPTSSNSRVMPRDRTATSPGKSLIARPVSPAKTSGSAANILSSMVEKARSTRATGATRNATATSTASSSNGSTVPATRTRRGGAPGTTTTTKSAGATASRNGAPSRQTRRASGVSESSERSNSTVVRKRTVARGTAAVAATSSRAAAPASSAKRTVMGTIRKGVTGGATRKAPTAKAPAPAAAPPAGTGRVLRKRA
ncbi:hypothetical protein VTK73DRAFT_607 [Phialemonium thermophilum]|uniref:Borealin N-terminal domain-containing protein n=1 Tax=Phialemonium thermophilum TaxID=223376 RepID=A0ABR3XE30_9PEZI